MLADDGMIIVKFFLHISDGEQLKRFEARQKDPLKTWKLTDEDWRNRAKRPKYEAAIEEMFERTDTERAPWRIVPAESKRHARVQVMREVIAAIEEGCAHHDFVLPEPLVAAID
jgi:AMP-polyphosphate phosphotransferase